MGCFISGQTADLAPADRVLYALRNETCTVESIPLIVGSILSKKLAEGVERLVLDVKTGSGAFMQRKRDARALATALVRVAQGAGVDCSAAITAMDRPLGRAVGNALEVAEAMQALGGGGPSDLRTVVLALADHPDAEAVLDSGAALERFRAMVKAQGGDPDSLEEGLLGAGCVQKTVAAERDGIIRKVDARAVGEAAFALGAGRVVASQPVDFGVGVMLGVYPGDVVEKGAPIAVIHHRDGRGLEEAEHGLLRAIRIGDAPGPLPPLVHEYIH